MIRTNKSKIEFAKFYRKFCGWNTLYLYGISSFILDTPVTDGS